MTQLNRVLRLFRRAPRSIAIILRAEDRGLFSLLTSYIDLAYYMRCFNLSPSIYLINHNYLASGDDLLAQVFKQDHRVSIDKCAIKIDINSTQELPDFRRISSGVTMKDAQKLSSQLLNLTDELELEIEKFMYKNLPSDFIGIHWRGTDHHVEAKPIKVDEIISQLIKFMEDSPNPIEYVFMASDDQRCLDTLLVEIPRIYPNLNLVFSNTTRSATGAPLHFSEKVDDLEEKLLFDAVFDCIVLSKSIFLIRNRSNLSAWCSIFNPDLRFVALGDRKEILNFYEWRWLT